MAQIFPPSPNTLARARIVGGVLNPNAPSVIRYPLARSSKLPGTACLSRLVEGAARHAAPATKDKLAEEERMHVIANHHTYSHGGKAAEHTP